MRGNRTETKLSVTIGPVNKTKKQKKMQPTKFTWRQTEEVMRQQESAEPAKRVCTLMRLSNTTMSTV